MSMVKIDIVKYFSKSLIGGLLIYGYDYFNYKGSLISMNNLTDSGVMFGSILSSQIIKDLIADLIKIDPNSLQYKLIEPLLNSIIYAYAYNFFVSSKMSNMTPRNNNINYLIAGSISLVLTFFENPLI